MFIKSITFAGDTLISKIRSDTAHKNSSIWLRLTKHYPCTEIILESMIKNALNRRSTQLILSAFIIGSTFFAIVYPTATYSFVGVSTTVYTMLGLLAIGLVFFTLDNRGLMMLSFSACAALCLILKDHSSNAEFLMFQEEASLKVALFQPSEKENDFCDLAEIIRKNEAEAIVIKSISQFDAKSLAQSLAERGYEYHYQPPSRQHLGNAYFYNALLTNNMKISGAYELALSPEQKMLVKERYIQKKSITSMDPLVPLLELKNYNFVDKINCSCSFSASHDGVILIYEFDSNAKKTS